MLRLTGPRTAKLPYSALGASRFLMPIQECEFQLTGLLESLTQDPWPVGRDQRFVRCTGVALSIAIALLESTYPDSSARVVLFAGGPTTAGPGLIVSNELREPIRTHNDLEREIAKHYKRAVEVSYLQLLTFYTSNRFQFYEGLAKRSSCNGHVIDIFAGCLDQVGLHEMKSLPNSTNGVMVLTDSFHTSIFKQSFLRLFNKDEQGNLSMGFNATFDVHVCHFFHVDSQNLTLSQ